MNIFVASSSSSPTTDLAPTVSPSSEAENPPTQPRTNEECFTDLSELDRVMKESFEMGQSFRKKVYTLCPNTTFNVGTQLDDEGMCCSDGQDPILPFANTVIQCGEDGKSSNNCLIIGGTTQVASNVFYPNEVHENIEFRGITFSGAGLSVATFADVGDYTFVDCVFKVRTLCGCGKFVHGDHLGKWLILILWKTGKHSSSKLNYANLRATSGSATTAWRGRQCGENSLADDGSLVQIISESIKKISTCHP